MAEEDNPIIRKHLGEIAPYQINITPFGTAYWGGTSAANRLLPVSLRHWALRRVITPTFSSMHINVAQNRISSLGWDTWDEFWNQMASYNMATITADLESLLAHNTIDTNNIVTETNVSVVSSAALTLTGAANTNEKVVYASVQNDTRGPTTSCAITPNGGTAAIHTNVNAGTAGDSIELIGGGGRGGNQNINSILGPIWLQPSDTAEISIDNFVAADVVRKQFISEVYSM